MNDSASILMHKITQLAIDAGAPLIIIQNPKDGEYRFKAGIGNAWVGFDSYYPVDLIDLYADLKATLLILQQERQNGQSSQQSNASPADPAGNQA